MYSRRTFLKGFFVIIPFLLAPTPLLNKHLAQGSLQQKEWKIH